MGLVQEVLAMPQVAAEALEALEEMLVVQQQALEEFEEQFQ